MLAIEGAHGLGKQNWEATLEDLHRQGLTVLGLAWSFSNQFAGSSGDGGGGLTAAGRRLLKHCQQLGILIDVSHASKESTMQACQNSPVPVIASHSNATAVHPHARNLTDEEIQHRGIRRSDWPEFSPAVLGWRNQHRTNCCACKPHCSGSRSRSRGPWKRFDGLIQPAHGLTTSADLPALWRALRKSGWTRAQLDGIRGENFSERGKRSTTTHMRPTNQRISQDGRLLSSALSDPEWIAERRLRGPRAGPGSPMRLGLPSGSDESRSSRDGRPDKAARPAPWTRFRPNPKRFNESNPFKFEESSVANRVAAQLQALQL